MRTQEVGLETLILGIFEMLWFIYTLIINVVLNFVEIFFQLPTKM